MRLDAPRWRKGIPVTTTPTLPGFEIVEYVGEVFGMVVRSRGAFPVLGAKLKTGFGGELRSMTKLMDESRREAVSRMVQEAEGDSRLRANAGAFFMYLEESRCHESRRRCYAASSLALPAPLSGGGADVAGHGRKSC